jgi:hypothetical protein
MWGVLRVLIAVAGTTAALAANLPAVAPLPPPRPDRATPPPAPPSGPVRADDGEDAGCLAELDRLAVSYEPLAAIADGACGAAYPLRVKGLPDAVEVSPPATMTCPVARALARWTLDVVAAEADGAFKSRVLAVQIGTSYECRGQNRRNGAKLSEHAFADGIDVMGFALEHRRTATIGTFAPETPEARFQAAVREGACRYFTTVLGPGSDPEHATHLHLDLRDRRGGYRICQ